MIEIQQLQFGYQKKQKLFTDLQLTLSPGLIHGLFGRNGAGKTTLLKLIQGLRFPHKGTIHVFGHDPSKREQAFLANTFFLSEEPYLPHMPLKKFISIYSPFYPRFEINQLFQILNEFGLSRDMHLGRASMGQKKKALIAFALASNTDILIMDEPTNGLDIPSKRQFRKIISHILRDDRIFIISTHQVRDLHSVIDNVVVLDEGQIIFDQTVSHIMDTIHFSIKRSPPSGEDIIYYERVPGGYLCISSGASDTSLEIDIETLFNAILAERESVLSTFKRQADECI